jgi:hypothetical protein
LAIVHDSPQRRGETRRTRRVKTPDSNAVWIGLPETGFFGKNPVSASLTHRFGRSVGIEYNLDHI